MTDVATKPTTGARTSPTVSRRALMKTLERIAQERGLRPTEIAERTGTPVQTVRRWLKGENLDIKPAQVITLLGAYGYSADHDLTQQLVRLAMAAKQRNVTQPRMPWMDKYEFNMFVGLEQGASRIIDVETAIVPGLLQTAAYAEAVIRATEVRIEDTDIAERVAVRLGRQEVLRRPDPLRLVAILDEAVLRRGPTDRTVMRAQMEYLRAVIAELPHVDIRVVPFNAGLTVGGETGPFVLMEFEDGIPPVAYSETPAQALYVEETDGIARYRTVVEQLTSCASTGDTVAGMITRALRDL